MKIVIINGQEHKGSTYHLAKIVEEKIEGEKSVTEFFLPRDLPYFCKGCYSCIEDETKCYCYEQKKVILDAVEEADVLIFTTPTYCMHVSAQMKAFLDLSFDRWMVHRPRKEMFQKRALILSTSAGSGTKSAMKAIKDSLFNLGVPEVIMYGKAVHAMNWNGVKDKQKAKIEKDLTRIAKNLSRSSKPHVGIKTKGWFLMMRMLQKGGMGSSPVEKEYWEEKGWLGKGRPWKEVA
ncbi:MAG: NAD(P)H-dependent oxidoreductase [Clostridiales bacterium]|nr:NAD(P)H-dependent oxidoreductase [Clostridiales bacterium]